MTIFAFEEFKDIIDSRYRLVALAAKRAVQISRERKKTFDQNPEDPVVTALKEIKTGKINFSEVEEIEFVPEKEDLEAEIRSVAEKIIGKSFTEEYLEDR